MEGMKRSCIDCGVGNCDHMTKKYPQFCVGEGMDEALRLEAMTCYRQEENRKMMIAAAEVEYENYCKMTRVEETAEFCRKMGYRKIGIATCVGLLQEAGIVAKIFRKKGFEVFGIGCKAGATPKTAVGIPAQCQEIGQNMCNPILQAKKLNQEGSEFNLIIGLCVGHDSLFTRYSEAPVSTLIAKDRVLAHNPVGALYQSKAYYSRLLED